MKHLAMKHLAVLGVVAPYCRRSRFGFPGSVGMRMTVCRPPPTSRRIRSSAAGPVVATLPPVELRAGPAASGPRAGAGSAALRPAVPGSAPRFMASVPAVPGSVPAVRPPLSAPSAPPPAASPSMLHPSPKSILPAEFEQDSAFFCQKLISAWTEQRRLQSSGLPAAPPPRFRRRPDRQRPDPRVLRPHRPLPPDRARFRAKYRPASYRLRISPENAMAGMPPPLGRASPIHGGEQRENFLLLRRPPPGCTRRRSRQRHQLRTLLIPPSSRKPPGHSRRLIGRTTPPSANGV